VRRRRPAAGSVGETRAALAACTGIPAREIAHYVIAAEDQAGVLTVSPCCDGTHDLAGMLARAAAVLAGKAAGSGTH
jgi:hypothetical protein